MIAKRYLGFLPRTEKRRSILFEKWVVLFELEQAVSHFCVRASRSLVRTIYKECSDSDRIIFAKFVLSLPIRPYIQKFSQENMALIHDQMKAVKGGDLTAIRLFARLGADMNVTTLGTSDKPFATYSYLQYAVLRGSLDLIDLLLECGAYINLMNDIDAYEGRYKPQTALFFAVSKKKRAVVARLLQSGADPNVLCLREGIPALALSVHNRTDAITELLLRHHADPNCFSNKGLSPLHLAIEEEKSKDVIRLLSAGGDPTLQSTSGQSALDTAVRVGNQKILHALHEYSGNNERS